MMPHLQCRDVRRDAGCINALVFTFNRSISDDEMRFLLELMQSPFATSPALPDQTGTSNGEDA